MYSIRSQCYVVRELTTVSSEGVPNLVGRLSIEVSQEQGYILSSFPHSSIQTLEPDQILMQKEKILHYMQTPLISLQGLVYTLPL